MQAMTKRASCESIPLMGLKQQPTAKQSIMLP
jgi:hypothetical protein